MSPGGPRNVAFFAGRAAGNAQSAIAGMSIAGAGRLGRGPRIHRAAQAIEERSPRRKSAGGVCPNPSGVGPDCVLPRSPNPIHTVPGPRIA